MSSGPVSIRHATMGDYDGLVALFDELDEFGATVDWSRGQGASRIGVAVHAFNRDARRFSERAGFAASIDRLVLAV